VNDATTDPGPDPAAHPEPHDVSAGAPADRPSRPAAIALGVLVGALAFAAGIGVGRVTAPGGADAPPSLAVASPGTSPGTSPGPAPSPTGIAALPSEGNRLGRADAKVVIEYWADFQCPFCARFAQDVLPQLVSRIEDGTVAVVHRDYAFLGEESLDAAVAVRCAGREGRYWAMHDAVYAGQVGENQGAFARPRLAQIATAVGLDAAAFAACMDEREPLVDVLDDTSAGVRAGIESTPTTDVNGNRFLGVPDMPAFLAAIDAAAAGATPAPLPSAAPPADPWTGIETSGREAGDAAAPVTVELWMDYQATGSAVIANDLGPELRSRITAGDIRVVQRDLATLGEESAVAASAVRCVASQDGPTWFTHDVLAVSARGQGAGIYTPTSILRFGARIGLDVRALSECMDDPAIASAVAAETAEGTAAGLTAGPVVIVRTASSEVARFSGELDVAAITAAIDAAR
jgi:protein-disulfide isomerase